MGWANDSLHRMLTTTSNSSWSKRVAELSKGKYENSKNKKDYVKRTSRYNYSYSSSYRVRNYNKTKRITANRREIEDMNNFEMSFNFKSSDIKAIKKFDSNGYSGHKGVFNVTIMGILRINGVNLWLSNETGEYSVSMPSKKTGKGYFPFVALEHEQLQQGIIAACYSALNSSDKTVEFANTTNDDDEIPF